MKGFGQKSLAAGVGAMLLVAAGCSVDVYSPPPRGEVVVESPPPQGDVVVTDQPPVVEEEVAPPPPPGDVGAVWIQGDVFWDGGRWVRHPGHYGHPPAGRRHWVAGTYRRGEHGYVRVAGHWE